MFINIPTDTAHGQDRRCHSRVAAEVPFETADPLDRRSTVYAFSCDFGIL